MSFFSSSKKENSNRSKTIRPVVTRTQNVAKELLEIAKSKKIDISTLDFNLLDIQTYSRVNTQQKEGDWQELDDMGIEDVDEKQCLDKNFQIKQIYEIEIISKKEDNPYKQFHLAVGANSSKCKIYASIKAGSKLKYNPRLEHELLLMVNKSKIRANILINIFDEMLRSTISKIVATVRVNEQVTYDKNETHLIAQSYEPTITIDDSMLFHFQDKSKTDDNDQVDYSSRGFINNVLKDELLIEYIKPQAGKSGRNCRGEYMTPKEPASKNVPAFTIDKTIRTTEDDKTIKYFANENGYITKEGTVYIIKQEVDVGQISFKTTGSIDTSLDSDVIISVKETNAVKDAIGMGMKVEVSEIDVEGNVGSNASIIANKATIGGQVHQSATVKAEKLNVNVLKGKAFGKEIRITRLEHGEVDGDTVKVSQAMGGHIRAKEIVIEICGSHLTATASKTIEIKKLQGSENTFIIDSLLKKNTQKGFDENQDMIDQLQNDVKSLKLEIEKFTLRVKTNTKAFNDVKKRLLHYKKNGVKMPTSFVKQYQQFGKIQEHLKTIIKEYEVKADKLKLLTTKTASFQDKITDARIINRDRWNGYNELIFKLVEPPIELIYKPQEGSVNKIFAVVEVDDGQYEIQAVKE